MNLKYELDKILTDYGRDVLILRKEEKLFCSCYNEVRKEARRDCPYCLGLGYSFIAERHRIRAVDTNVRETLSRLIKDTNVGGVGVSARRYYTRAELKAKEEDLIIEVDWDDLGRPKYTGKGIYSISHVNHNMHLKDNEKIFNILSVSEQVVSSKIRAVRINELHNIKHYQVLLEEE